jgi:flavin reductase (DIM6/NTAB) family NADH-FMN oxidoreductase RutF
MDPPAPHGRRTVSPSPFEALVASMDAAMVVVTAAAGDQRDGCLVGFHSQCSIDPPRYAVWLSVANRTHELAHLGATHLGVHVLGVGDHDLAQLFGGETGDQVDKLARCDWDAGPGGVPLLRRCPTRFVGRIVESAAGVGDHDGFVLDVVEATVDGDRVVPLRLAAATDIDPGHDAGERR